MTFIKNIYYKFCIILTSKRWLQLTLNVLIYYLLLSIMIYMGKPPSAPSSEEIDLYKELLAEYRIRFENSVVPLNLKTLNDFISSSNFVHEEFQNINNFWSPNVETIMSRNNEVVLHVKGKLFMLPQLTEDEKLLHFNYLSTVLAYDYIQVVNNGNVNINGFTHFLDVRDKLIQEGHTILDTHAKITEYKARLFPVYCVMIIGGALLICLMVITLINCVELLFSSYVQ
jgi:hypothetical protein